MSEQVLLSKLIPGKLYIITKGVNAGDLVQRVRLGGRDNVIVLGEDDGWSEVDKRDNISVTARLVKPSDLNLDILSKLL